MIDCENKAAFGGSLRAPQYYVLREKGTEPPGSGKYNKHKEEGIYECAGRDLELCGAWLFHLLR